MKELTKKLPLAIYLCVFSCGAKIFNLINALSTSAGNGLGVVLAYVIPVLLDVAMIAVIFRGKKDLPLFVVFAIAAGRSVLSLITGFSIGAILGCVASLALAFIVGTVVLPQLAEYQEKAKKMYFVPALLIFIAGIISNIALLQHIIRTLPISVFIIYLLPAITSLFVASWCLKAPEEDSVGTKKEKFIFKIVVAVLIVCAALSVAIETASTPKSNNHSGEPWKDLGVSRSEYEKVYNYYKYGNP